MISHLISRYCSSVSNNTFGRRFTITTFGESHGPAIGVVLDGVPPMLPITEADIQKELDRRRPGQSSVTTPRSESDSVEILSGVFEGHTTGAPIALLIRNQNQKSGDYDKLKNVFRPGHADYTFFEKFGVRDYRGGGRSSGRETAARVAAGAIAKVYLATLGITITSYTVQVGDIVATERHLSSIESNIVRCADPQAALKMIALIESVKAEGDSIGGVVETVIQGAPVGLGDPVFDKLDAVLSHAVMSIGTVKGIEFGAGFGAARMKGSESNDPFTIRNGKVETTSNHAGGILGGISNGSEIVFRAAIKPPSSISKMQQTVNQSLEPTAIEVLGRHDPCICPRVVPVIEAMTAITLVDAILVQKAIR